LGGGTAFTFLKALGIAVGKSPVENEYLSWVTNALSRYSDKILLPEDHIAFDLLVEDKSRHFSPLGFTTSVVDHIPNEMTGI